MAAVSVTTDDRFTALEDLVPNWDRIDPGAWRQEVESYLDDHDDGLGEYGLSPLLTDVEKLEMVVPQHKVRSPRAARRRLQRRRLRGVRPKDPVEAKTSSWYKTLEKKLGSSSSGIGREARFDRPLELELAHTLDGSDDGEIFAAATADVTDEAHDETYLVLEKPAYREPILRVVIPQWELGAEAVESDSEVDARDELVELMVGDDPADEVLDLPYGVFVQGGGCFNRRTHYESLALAAQIEPDWGDPDRWDLGRFEPRHLIVRH